MSKVHSNNVKKGKLKMFLLFLVITTFIWFLSKFSKEVTATVEAEIQYVNVPENVLISSNNDNSVLFDLTSNGFDFLFYKINQPIISIDVLSYYKNGAKEITISKKEFLKIINSQIKKNIAVKNLSFEKFKIALDVLKTKNIKVIFNGDIHFENGFKSIEGLKITPDSISISGPSRDIDSISEIVTKPLKLNDLKESVSQKLKILEVNSSTIFYSQHEVELTINVKEFTQKSLSIPIQIKNLPEQINLKIIPEMVSVKFDISMDMFNKYSETDFSIICDYTKRNVEENFMIPFLLKKPDSIINIELGETQIKYLIFK